MQLKPAVNTLVWAPAPADGHDWPGGKAYKVESGVKLQYEKTTFCALTMETLLPATALLWNRHPTNVMLLTLILGTPPGSGKSKPLTMVGLPTDPPVKPPPGHVVKLPAYPGAAANPTRFAGCPGNASSSNPVRIVIGNYYFSLDLQTAVSAIPVVKSTAVERALK